MTVKEDKPEDIATMLFQIDGLQGRAVSIDEDGDCSWTIVPAPSVGCRACPRPSGSRTRPLPVRSLTEDAIGLFAQTTPTRDLSQ